MACAAGGWQPWWPYRAILSLQDMVSSLSPCSTPSHVWMLAFDRTGIVPSPDSIFVRSCPLALRFGCRSAGSEREKASSKPWGEDQVLAPPNLKYPGTRTFTPRTQSRWQCRVMAEQKGHCKPDSRWSPWGWAGASHSH